MISVVMAAYNGEKYIIEQLASIWGQDIRPDEIIVSDDASTDHTVALVEEFARSCDAPVRLVKNKEQKGYIRNFLAALSEARGDIIFLSDQDDIWMNNRIRVCVELMTKHPDILSLSSAYQLIDGNGNRIKERFKRKNTGDLRKVELKTFLRHPKYPGVAMVVRRSLVEQVCAQKNTIAAHDWQLNLEASRRDGMFFLDKKLVQYRQHQSNTIGTLRSGQRNGLLYKRIQLLIDLQQNLDTIKNLNSMEKIYVEKLRKSLGDRVKLLNDKCWLGLAIYGVAHLKYVSMVSVLGDMYAVLR